jgi:hypothetical protein
MKKVLLMLALVGLISAPVLADVPRTLMGSGPLSADLSGAVAPGPRSSTVYQFTNTNNYYHAFLAPDVWDGEYVQTTQAGAWTMDGFSVGWYAPTGAPQTSLYVDFYFDDGYLPNALNYVTGYTIPVTADGLAHTNAYPVTPVVIPTGSLWVTYSWDVAGAAAPNMGPLHVGVPDPDPGASIGTDLLEDGWYEWDGAAYHWWWYGGTPSSDLYLELSMLPEPATLALLGLGALALLRRR